MSAPTLTGMTVCSGIGAPEVAAPWIDWRFQSEVAPFPSAVLAHRFPDAVNLGDMTQYQEWPDATLDVLVGGTPCQSFSVAGLRKGLADPRGNLMLTFLAIARRYRPRWIVWENVPGVLSSNEGRDFGAFLGGLGQCGYGWAYRVLDAQYVRTPNFPFAVPQRRRRVFVVGCLGDWARAAAVLFEPEGLRGDPPPRRDARQGVAANVAPSLVSSGRGVERAGDTRGQDPVIAVDVCGAINNSGGNAYPGQTTQDACAGQLVAFGGNNTRSAVDVAAGLNARSTQRLDFERETLLAFSSKDYGADAEIDLSPTLRAGGHDGSHANAGVPPAIAIQERAVAENPDAGPDGAGVRVDGAAYTLEARAQAQAVAFAENSRAEVRLQGGDGNVAPQLTTGGGKPGQGQPCIATPYAVRRLTPLECERLQGFKDGWTAIPMAKRNRDAETEEMRAFFERTGQDEAIKAGLHMAFDGPRYKALGNSWAVNCGAFVFERMRAVEAMGADFSHFMEAAE
ncbi:MAG: DNA (cytosine-5-)-methyltransferase [Pseudomonadota bacterium]